MFETIAEYDRMYSENPFRWDLVELDKLRFETLQPYGVPRRLLDIGCGSGHTLAYFADRWKTTEYFGIDLSPAAIRIARRVMPFADIRCELLTDSTLGDMDTILLGGTAEHFIDLAEGFVAVGRALADDGIVYLEVPNCLAYREAHGEGFYRTRADGQMEWHLPRERWEAVITENGFDILKSVKGPKAYNEFIWILTRKKE